MFTTDTRKAHCPIRIVYSGSNPNAGPIHATELTDRIYLPRDYPLAVIKATEHSDYSGGDVQASNFRAMWANEDMKPHLVQIFGSHGYQALAYDATLGPFPDSWDIANALDGFENHYPLFDDDDHSELESELETEAWDDHGRRDFREALVKLFDSIDDSYEHELPEDDSPVAVGSMASFLNGLWSKGCNEFNVNGGTGFVVETGCVVHFYISDWCARAGADKRYATLKPIHRLLNEIAVACRTVEDDEPAIDPDAYCREHGCPRATCDESH